MIKITADKIGHEIKLDIGISGAGEDIAREAARIMEHLPKRLEEMNKGLFLRFLAELVSTDMFDIGMKRVDPEEDVEC